MASKKGNGGVYTVNLEEIDPGIKLFGRKIEMQTADLSMDQTQNTASEASSQLDDLGSSSGSCEEETILKAAGVEDSESLKKLPVVQSAKSEVPSPPEVTAPTPQVESTEEQKKQQEQQQEKRTLKRPDKLVPCPRCNSMDTKFCYFNNYNVNQPRHFCKNCQRYWTAGGTLRNVPVGAGRRKSKHTTSTTNSNSSIGDHSRVRNFEHPGMKLPPPPSIIPPEFCHFVPPPEASSPSVASSMLTSLSSGVSSGSSSKKPSPSEQLPEKEAERQKECTGCSAGFNMNPVWPCFGWNNFPSAASVAAAAASLHQNGREGDEKSNSNSSTTAPVPGAENLAVWMNALWANPFLWGASVPGWNVPWAAAVSAAFAAAASQFPKTLGKHPRDRIEGCGRVDGCLWAPKTLRIDDPMEAAKSSIWATLGLDRSAVADKDCTKGKLNGEPDDKGVGCVNPAARSRSMSFQENN